MEAERTLEPRIVDAMPTVAKDGAVMSVGATDGGRRIGQLAGPGLLTRLWRQFLGWGPFLLLVVAPTALASVYFGYIAADRYVAEAQFVVRSADRTVATGLGAILQSTGLNQGQNDAYIVQSFMTSRDALEQLEREHGFSTLMGREEADLLARWPTPYDAENFEGLYDYYQRRVAVVRDVTSGVSTLSVEAFRPEDALLLANALLAAGERLVNQMNSRAQRDALQLAREEVALAEARVAENQRAFSAFRQQEGMVSPLADAELRLELVGRLSSELSVMEAEIRRLASSAPDSPQLPALRRRASAMAAQIASEKSMLAGADGALSERYGAFESLLLEQEFGQEALLAARAGLEQARLEALRQQRYLETVVSPRAPDDARQPQRVRMIAAIAAGAMLIYAIIWLLWANVREHRG